MYFGTSINIVVRTAARAETRNRERHLPPISVYRWWARLKTELVNGALRDAVAAEFASPNLVVADPFAGGGIIPLAALVRGHAVYAQDLNPWVAEGLASMLNLPTRAALEAAGQHFFAAAGPLANKAYGTTFSDGTPAVIAHSLRVAVAGCSACGHRQRHFPHALVSLTRRKDRGGRQAMLACRCGHLFLGDTSKPTTCPKCSASVDPSRKLFADACGDMSCLRTSGRP